MTGASFQRTKIVCTLGPSTDRSGVLRRLILAGLDVARINGAHANTEEHIQRIRTTRQLARELGRNVSILVDLPGPKHRLGKLFRASVQLRKKETIQLGAESGDKKLPLAEKDLVRDLRVGDSVFLADGTVRLVVTKKERRSVRCRVEVGGVVRSGSGLNLPGASLSVRLPTFQDRKILRMAIAERVEWVGVSFVRTASDIKDVRRALPKNGEGPRIVAKIEKGEALKNLNDIIRLADGVMVARGDLGVETPLEEVPLAQKLIIAQALEQGKPVITATQMLESMVENSSPTRAEVTDVANAILDGTDAVMLSAETAVGAHPLEAVQTLAAIIRATESQFPYGALLEKLSAIAWTEKEDALSLAAVRLSFDLKASAILVAGASPSAVARITRFRPKAPVLVLEENARRAAASGLIWDARALTAAPEHIDRPASLAALLKKERIPVTGPVVVFAAPPRSDPRVSSWVRVVRL